MRRRPARLVHVEVLPIRRLGVVGLFVFPAVLAQEGAALATDGESTDLARLGLAATAVTIRILNFHDITSKAQYAQGLRTYVLEKEPDDRVGRDHRDHPEGANREERLGHLSHLRLVIVAHAGNTVERDGFTSSTACKPEPLPA